MSTVDDRDVVRFWQKVNKTDSCWLWTDVPGHSGYGTMSLKNKCTRAHRISWVIHNGPIPEGLYVCHTCDVRHCVNPNHLFLGTHLDNMMDMERKGRKHITTIDDRPQAKLSDEVVLEIRKLVANGVSLGTLGKKHGVSKNTIWNAARGKTWKHVPMPDRLTYDADGKEVLSAAGVEE